MNDQITNEQVNEKESVTFAGNFNLEDFFKAGVHFGHKTSKWNPAMKKYIYGTKDTIHIIDLEKTSECLEQASRFITDVISKNGVIMFIGTKKQAAEPVKQVALKCNMPYVINRWIGGTFTNFNTIHSQIKKMKDLEKQKEQGGLAKYTKREQMLFDEEIERLNTLMGGIKDLDRLPEAIFVVDLIKDILPVREAKKRDIKTIGFADTNTDPNSVDFPIPANDDAISSITLLLNIIADIINKAKASSVK